MTEAWDTSVPDWEQRIIKKLSLIPKLPLFDKEAEKALRIFKRLKVPDIEGTPTHGEICAEWMFDLVRVIFGSYDAKLKQRMIREFFILIPKKNGKSSIAAAIMVVAIIMNRRPEAEFLLIAPTKKIADIAFKQASGIIRLDLQLKKIFHLTTHQRTITHRVTGAQLLIRAADTDVITGSKSTGILVDETHEFAKKANAANVFVEVRGSLAARPDGFMLQITTQSKDIPAGVFKDELAMAREVRDGKIKMPLLPIMYELPAKMQVEGAWRDRATWPLVNPNLGLSVSEDFLVDELKRADRAGIQALTLFASQHFNVEIGIGLRADRWAGAEHWRKQSDPSLTLEEVMARSEVIVVGLDGGGLDDLFGFSALGRDKTDSRIWLSWSHAWCHKGVLDRRKSIAQRLQDYEKLGELTIVGDDLSDIMEIVDIIDRINKADLLAAVAVDPAGIGEMIDALDVIDVTAEGKQVIGAPQGFAMMNAIKTAERKLANGTLKHNGSTLMTWAVSNLKIEPMATAIRATKQNAGDAKIDPVMALFDAVTVMSTNPEPAGSVYTAERGLIFA